MSPKSSPKLVKNSDGLQGAVSIDFRSILLPKWRQHGTKMDPNIVAKSGCDQKGAFSLPYSKTNGFSMKIVVRGIYFWS